MYAEMIEPESFTSVLLKNGDSLILAGNEDSLL